MSQKDTLQNKKQETVTDALRAFFSHVSDVNHDVKDKTDNDKVKTGIGVERKRYGFVLVDDMAA